MIEHIMCKIYLRFGIPELISKGFTLRTIQPMPVLQIMAYRRSPISYTVLLLHMKGYCLPLGTFYAKSPVKPILCGIPYLIFQIYIRSALVGNCDISANKITMNIHARTFLSCFVESLLAPYFCLNLFYIKLPGCFILRHCKCCCNACRFSCAHTNRHRSEI